MIRKYCMLLKRQMSPKHVPGAWINLKCDMEKKVHTLSKDSYNKMMKKKKLEKE